jgi:Abnormal spindle-like microcephaly-assoc'd, ASPM-SPD-2-Hydin
MSSLSPSALGRLVSVAMAIGALLISASNLASATTKILTVTPTTIWFGGIPVGQTASHTVTLSNAGTGSLTISKVTRTDSSVSTNLNLPITLVAGQSVRFVVSFTPSFVGHINAAVIFTSSATNSRLYLYVNGGGKYAESLAPSSSSLSFSGVQVGSSQTLPETVTNYGSSSITVSATYVKGSQFSATGPGLPLTLAPGHRMTLNVTFTPTNTNTSNGSLSVISNSPNLVIPISGRAGAAGVLSVSPGSLKFGNVTVGSSANKTGTLNASGGPVVVTAASVNSSEFSLTGLSFPVTITAGNSVSFKATFAPQSTGAASANFTFNAASQVTQSLAGTGMAGTSHSVGLSWEASSSRVEGYNVYRGTASTGPYSKLDSTLDTHTSYTDSTVQSGKTYFYVTTAVGTDGIESGYSNQVEATIP